MNNLKSYSELSDLDRKLLVLGDAIACESCRRSGVWNSSSLASSMLIIGSSRLCETCELSRSIDRFLQTTIHPFQFNFNNDEGDI